jgi:hypothetical protein
MEHELNLIKILLFYHAFKDILSSDFQISVTGPCLTKTDGHSAIQEAPGYQVYSRLISTVHSLLVSSTL